MIQDDLTKKIAAAAMDIMAEDNTNDKSDDGKGLDKVQPKAVKKKFDDRKDKDIDNDGDVDSSDEYLHKRRKAISKSTKEETELEEATELYKKGKITLTKFAMGKGKGAGLQINYGMKFIQIPEKDIKQLYTAMVYVTKSVPQFKESVDVEEGFYADAMSSKDKKRLDGIYKEMDKVDVKIDAAIKKGDAKTVDKLGKEKQKLTMQVVNFFKEDAELEEASTDLEEALKPDDFVKGGDAKITKREVDKMLSKIFVNAKMAKTVENNGAYKAGLKDAGKKKNPYAKDTADFHLYVLGVQSADLS